MFGRDEFDLLLSSSIGLVYWKEKVTNDLFLRLFQHTMLLVFSGLAAIGGGVSSLSWRFKIPFNDCSCDDVDLSEARMTVWRNLSAKSPDIGGVKS